MNVASLLARAGRSSAERPALALGERTLASYGELSRRAAALGGALRGRLGLGIGDRVALAMTNVPAYLESLFGIWHGGLVAVPLNHKLHPRELEYVLGHSGASACLATPALAGAVATIRGALPRLRHLVDVGSAAYQALTAGPSDAGPADVPEGAPAWLFYTSGTTGRPKGATLSHRNLLAMTCSYFADVDTIDPGDCILHAAPMSHGSGLYILPHVAAAAKHVVPESGHFDPAEIFDLLEVHRGVTLFAAPTMVFRLVESPRSLGARLENLKTIVYGGGPMYLAQVKRALARLGPRLAQIYGQGESPMTITALSKARHADSANPRWEERLSSVGTPHTVVEVRVADADGRTLPAGETGEVLVRGATVMGGYWEDPLASQAALAGGWLHTGDQGAFSDDGFLTLKDRSKDLIIRGGSNIYPREVEEVLLGHPGVMEAAVVGAPDPEWGEEVVAYVVARPGQAVDPAALDALCLGSLARFKRPRHYRFVEALPKNEYGKVMKRALREQAGGITSGAAPRGSPRG